jgi:hypothetical protein
MKHHAMLEFLPQKMKKWHFLRVKKYCPKKITPCSTKIV